MSFLEAILLGVLQGITEFLPVSSSGHLVVAERLFKINPNLTLNIFLHVGTVGAICFYYRKDLRALIGSFFKIVTGKKDEVKSDYELIIKLIAATIITAVLGLGLRDQIEKLSHSDVAFRVLGVMFFITTITMASLFFLKKESKLTIPSWGGALIIGLVQGFAVMPGISRSGSTIAVCLILGIGGKAAARFSFLLAIPVIIGASILETRHLVSFGDPLPLLAGVLAATITGFLSLVFLVKIVEKGNMAWFSIYLFPLSIWVFFYPVY